MKNILTVDVEDYFQVAALSQSIRVDQWSSIKPRVEHSTHRLLDLFDEHQVKATHFVLGWVAEKYPELVKEIDRRGHEVASHGFSHQLIYSQTPEVFYEETKRSKDLLENIVGKKVSGYRAASYSITPKSLWALDCLGELGFEYDSSIFPIHHDRYGIPGSPRKPHVLLSPKGFRLVEYPLSTAQFLGQTIPIAGGGYFRLYPYWLSQFFYRRRVKSGEPFVFYIHPWEVDPEQPKVKVSWFSKFRHYNNLDKCYSRLNRLLSEFEFTNMRDELESLELFDADTPVTVRY